MRLAVGQPVLLIAQTITNGKAQEATEMKRLHIRGAAVASAAMAMLLLGSTGAAAATIGVPGAVTYPYPTLLSTAQGNLHTIVVCQDNFPVYSADYETITIVGPSVYGAALPDGSRAQWVTYRADVLDFTTNTVTYGVWTAGSSIWKVASTTIPVQMPTVSTHTGVGHRLMVAVDIDWSEGGPGYSGQLSYLIQNSYSSSIGDQNANTHTPGTFCS